MPTHDEIVAARDRAAPVLLRLPNVTSVGIGGRVRSGQRIPELVLKVYVDVKVPAGQLAPSERIPSEVEGLPTDVVQMPTVGSEDVATPVPPGSPAIAFAQRDEDKYRPIVGGARIEGTLTDTHDGGTLGCIMVSTTDATKAYAFTNWHVMQGQHHKDPTIGQTKAGQPTNKDSVTKCCSHIIGTLVAGARNTSTDAALIELNPGLEWKAEVLDIGPLAAEHPVDANEAATHPAVRKRGDRTRLTGGVIDSINATVTVGGITRSNVIVVVPNPNPTLAASDPYFFGDHGDSGAVLVNDANQVVGVHLAHPGPPASGNYPPGPVAGWALPIADIESGLAAQSVPVKVAVAATAGIVNTVPGAAMVAVPQELAPSLIGAQAGADGRSRLVAVGLPLGDDPPAAALRRLEADLEQSARGRGLVTFWLRHQHELLELINSNRRVTITWHRSGASGLFQLLTRILSQPDLTVPETINGQPVGHCLDTVCAVLDRFASPQLRADLARTRAALPELGGLTYPRICSALAAG